MKENNLQNNDFKTEQEQSGEISNNCKTRTNQTKKQLFWEIFRFLIVGGTATVFDYAVSYLFYAIILPPSLIGDTLALVLSTALGFCVGLAVNWVLSITFVFKQVSDEKTAKSGKSFLVFTLVGVVGLIITEIGMHLGVNLFPQIVIFGTSTFLNAEWKWWICKVIMTCIVLVWNYLGRKILIFK